MSQGTESSVISHLHSVGFNSSDTYAYYDTLDATIYDITAFTSPEDAIDPEITTRAFNTSAAFSDLTGSFQGAAVQISVPIASGTYTYYDDTSSDRDWYYIVVPFQTAWQSVSTYQDLVSGRTWLTETTQAAVTASFVSGGFDNTLSYAYYDASDGSIQEVFRFNEAVLSVGAGLGSVARISGTGIDEEGFYYTMNVPAGNYTFSFYMRDATGTTPDEYTVRVFFGEDFESNIGGEFEIENDWTRYNFRYTVTEPQALRINWFVLRNNAASASSGIDVDAVQVEPAFTEYIHNFGQPHGDSSFTSSKLTDYIPFEVGTNRLVRWVGEAGESMCIREPGITEIHRVVITEVSTDAYIDFDRDATDGGSIFIPTGETFKEDIIVKERISFIGSGGRPTIVGYIIGK